MARTITVNGVNYTAYWRQYESRWSSRAYLGESAQSEFVFDDDANNLAHANLASRKVIEVWDDASGVNRMLYWGRVANKTLIRGDVESGIAMRWVVSAEDGNIDLRGIRVTDSSRPSESDRERVLAYMSAYLNGAASTNSHARASTDLDGTYVVAANLVTLPAEDYRDTFPDQVFQRICEISAKTFFVYPTDTGTRELFYSTHADTVLASTISITDDATYVAGSVYNPLTAEVSGEHEGQQVISGGGLRYGDDQFHEASNIGSSEADHDKWEEHFTDDFVATSASAQTFLTNVVAARNNEDFAYTVTIEMDDAHAHLIKAGMTLSFRSAACDVQTPTTLRAVQVQHTPLGPGRTEVTLDLGMPRGRPFRRNLRSKPLKLAEAQSSSSPSVVVGYADAFQGGTQIVFGLTVNGGSNKALVLLGQQDTGEGNNPITRVEWRPNADAVTIYAFSRILLAGGMEAWILYDPVAATAAGAYVDVSTSFNTYNIGVAYIQNTDPTGVVRGTQVNNGTSATASATIATAAGDLVLMIGGQFQNNVGPLPLPTPGGGLTSIATDAEDAASGQRDTAMGFGRLVADATSETPSWTFDASRPFLATAIAFRGSSSGATPPPVGATGTAGTGDTAARDDHTHAHDNITTGGPYHEAADVTETVDGTVQTALTNLRAPTYLVGAAHASLTNGIVVGAAPGGELGGTWAAPTVDAVHAGSAHGDATTTHEAAADPHAQYQRESEKGAASGYASLDAGTKVPTAQLGTGTADATTFLRGDRSWQPASAGHPDLATHDGLGLATDAELSAHAAAADPHTGYQKESEKGAASGYASLDAGTRVPFAQMPRERARVSHSVAQSIATSTITALAFDGEQYDIGGLHDTATNNSRLTAVNAGHYSIGGTLRYALNATGQRMIGIRLNGTTVIAYHWVDATAVIQTMLSITTDYELAANDYVELITHQNSGAALNVEAVAEYSPRFWIRRND